MLRQLLLQIQVKSPLRGWRCSISMSLALLYHMLHINHSILLVFPQQTVLWEGFFIAQAQNSTNSSIAVQVSSLEAFWVYFQGTWEVGERNRQMFYCLYKTPLFSCLIGFGFVSLVFCFVEKWFFLGGGDVGALMHLCFTCRNQQMLLNPRRRKAAWQIQTGKYSYWARARKKLSSIQAWS